MIQSRIKSRPNRDNKSFPPTRPVQPGRVALSERQQQQDRGLPREFWPDNEPVMIIPPAHFSGSYPPEPTAPKVCKTRAYITGQGETAVKVVKAQFSQWRGYTHQASGRFIQPCQHCRHNRVLETCQHIERASFQYSGPNLMRWGKGTPAEYKRLRDAIRQRITRGAALASPVSFPLSDGSIAWLHDAPDIGGEPLPENRRELYHLVSKWVLDTPKGKRAGKSLGTWGKPESKPEQQQGGKKQATEEKQTGKRWRLIVESYSKVLRELMAYEGGELENGRCNIPINELINRMDEAGIAWAVESGELPANVTLNREKQNTISAKCDNRPGKAKETAVFSHLQPDLPLEQPPKPAPIYLNGGWLS